MKPDAMFLKAKSLPGRNLVALLCGLLMTSCGGFGSTNNTAPGNTPNISAQTSFRILGKVGTPFSAKVSDARSSWDIQGVVPLSIIIVNNDPPVRISVTKLVSDDSLISVESINGFTIKQLASATDNFGLAVGNFGNVGAFAPPASPDVRFWVKGPDLELFDALVEDTSQGEVLEARVPALILFDSPAGGNGGRVDATFTAVTFGGNFDIDLLYNSQLVQSALLGTNVRMKFP
jgi:hypothetical protein